MRTTQMKRGSWMVVVGGALVALLAVGCGPKEGGTTAAGKGASGKGAGRTGTGPRVETKADGTVDVIPTKTVEVSEETKDRFRKVVALHADAKKTGTFKEKCDKIAEAYREVSEKDSTFLDGAFNYAALQLECGNAAVADGAFRDMIKRYPEYGRSYCGVATIIHGKTKAPWGEAKEWYGRCLEKDPTVVEGNLNMASIMFEEYERTKDSELLKKVVKHIRTALAVDASSMAAYALFAYVYYSLGQYRLAGLVCQQAKKYDDTYAPIWNVLGLIELANKNVTAALSHFKTAVAKDPDYVPGLINWGAITINYRDYDTAIDKFERAIKIGGDDYDVYLTLGVAYRGKGTGTEDVVARRAFLKKSEDAYLKAASLRSGEPAPYYNLGLLWENYKFTDDEKKNLSTAISHYDKFIGMVGARKDLEKLKKDAERRRKIATDLLKIL